MTGLDFTFEEQAVITAMRKAGQTAPDLCAVGALQELACLYLKVEPLLPDGMKATLFAAGAFIAAQAENEMKAMVQANWAINKARKP